MRIFVHSIGENEWLAGKRGKFEGIPLDYGCYASRAFLCAGKKDVVVMPADARSIQSKEVIPFLNLVGLGPDRKNILHIDVDLKTGEILAGKKALRRLARLIKKFGQGSCTVDVFSGKVELGHRLAEMVECKIAATQHELVARLEGKDFFMSLSGDCIPDGFTAYSRAETAAGLNKFAGWKMYAKTVHSAGGGNCAVLHEGGCGYGKVLKFFSEGMGVVFQEYVEHDSSPSVNLVVGLGGKIKPLFVTDQIIKKEKSGEEAHDGNIFPSALPLATQYMMLFSSIRLAKQMADNGYIGNLGVDWLANGEEVKKAAEINLRKTAPWYAFRAMRRLGAKAFCMKNVGFKAGMPASEIHARLEKVFFLPGKKSGVVFFNYIRDLGKTTLVAFGRYREEAVELCSAAEEIIKEGR